MRKEEFLTALRANLTGLSPEGVEKLVEFCSEMIDDRMEDGLTEEEAVAAAGPLDELVKQAKTELLPVKTANFTEKTTFGDTLRTYTAESSICGVAADCGSADFILLPSENNTCRVECAENETVHYVVTTENSVLHIRRADSRTVFSFFKFYRALRSEPVRVYLPQDAYKSLEVKVTSGDIAVPAGYTFDTASLHSASGDIACCAECGALSGQAASGDITLKDTSCGTLALGTASGAVTLLNIKNESGGSIETASGKVSLENAECAALHINTASGGVDLTHTVSADVMEIGTASGSIHFENCDAASLSLDSMSGSMVGTLNTGKAFRAQSRSSKVDVPFDTGEGTCKVSTLSGSIRIKIAK